MEQPELIYQVKKLELKNPVTRVLFLPLHL